MRYELILWFSAFLKIIPGNIGVFIRCKLLPAKVGKKSKIWSNVQIDSPSNLVIGEKSSINRGCILNCGGGIEIGNNVLIGPSVTIYSQNHAYKEKSTPINKQGYIKNKVIISDDVWIAANVTILPGVILAKGTVVAAGAVVTKSTNEYSVLAGVPAKAVAKRQ
jgi:maltose O-acetyltransferase